jgi:hypothetical protein
MDEMMRINQMNHCHKDVVVLLNLNVIDITIKVIGKGWTSVLYLLISLTCVHVRAFILVVYLNQTGEAPRLTCIDL